MSSFVWVAISVRYIDKSGKNRLKIPGNDAFQLCNVHLKLTAGPCPHHEIQGKRGWDTPHIQ